MRRAMERGNGGRRLLAWDAPNMDMCLSEVIGERATTATRPDLGAVYAWLTERCLPGDMLEACVFCNVPPGFEATMSPWVVSLRHMGYSVFAKPKRTRSDDVDGDIARHIERRFTQGSLVELIVASHDASAFAEPLRRYAKAGVPVLVLGYREKDTFAASSSDIIFVDMEEIPGAFERPLPRTNLFDLPTSGRWFEPFAPPPSPERGGAGVGRAGERDPGLPDRDAVLELIEIEVRSAAARGPSGLGLREVGDFLRLRFPTYRLDDLGFAGVADLVDAIERRGRLRVTRLEDGSHVVILQGPAAGVDVFAAELRGQASEPRTTPTGSETAPSADDVVSTPAEARPHANGTNGGVYPPAAAQNDRSPWQEEAEPSETAEAPGKPEAPEMAELPQRAESGTVEAPAEPEAPETARSHLALIPPASSEESELQSRSPVEPQEATDEGAEPGENQPGDQSGQHPIYRVFGVDRRV